MPAMPDPTGAISCRPYNMDADSGQFVEGADDTGQGEQGRICAMHGTGRIRAVTLPRECSDHRRSRMTDVTKGTRRYRRSARNEIYRISFLSWSSKGPGSMIRGRPDQFNVSASE